MAKRNRTKSRFEDFYELATRAHSEHLAVEKYMAECEDIIARNPDLIDGNAIETARGEFKSMMHPKVGALLNQIYDMGVRYMEAQPPGTSKRLNHVVIGTCRAIAKSRLDPLSALAQERARLGV